MIMIMMMTITFPVKFAMWQHLVTATEFRLNQPVLLSALVESTPKWLCRVGALQFRIGQSEYSVYLLVHRVLNFRGGQLAVMEANQKLV